MSNKEIANIFDQLADLLELYDENEFRVKTYRNVYIQLRKMGEPIASMPKEQLATLKGIGKATADKISEILQTGTLEQIQQYLAKTPEGVADMLAIQGLGPKKIKQLWHDLGIETVGELDYACTENRLIALKGFGQKTQQDIQQKIKHHLASKGKFLYAHAESKAIILLTRLQEALPDAKIAFTGDFRRGCPVLEQVEYLIAATTIQPIFDNELVTLTEHKNNTFFCKTTDELPIILYRCEIHEFGSKLFKTTGNRPFLEHFLAHSSQKTFTQIADEETLFAKAGIPYIAPELREGRGEVVHAVQATLPTLIQKDDLQGVLHIHTTYSDGVHLLADMALHAQALGYHYIGITDHSKSAFYANGLHPERLAEQWKEIQALNQKLAPFKIYKGIESDILNDGSLDYPDDILAQFDFVIASIHSNLKMDETKATERLLKAIANPYTRILGHPTGRLLLARSGYPIQHERIIDACAEHNVAIELNANPARLDLDWAWIPYALQKGVQIAINPDAHSREGITDVHYGIIAARKGGLSAAHCLNALPLPAFEQWLHSKK
jgi:DNA polymerase (family 10)